jgi:hypothetical protein
VLKVDTKRHNTLHNEATPTEKPYFSESFWSRL